jgi:hypothetical protein
MRLQYERSERDRIADKWLPWFRAGPVVAGDATHAEIEIG